MSEATHAYLGRRPCGCYVYAVIDDPRWKKDVAKGVAKALRDGMTIERHPLGSFANLLKQCACKKVPA